MAKQNPDLFLIKAGDGSDPVVYETLCGLASRNLTLDGDTIDVTTVDCSGAGGKLFQEMVSGTSKMSFSGSGFFENKAQHAALVNSKLSGTATNDYEVIVPGLGTFTGKFITESLGLAGEVGGGAVTSEMALVSTGTVTFVVEA